MTTRRNIKSEIVKLTELLNVEWAKKNPDVKVIGGLQDKIDLLTREYATHKDTLLEQAQALAEDLHSAMCNSNHTDECGWGYESWDFETIQRPHSVRAEYLAIAFALLEAVGFEKAQTVINLVSAKYTVRKEVVNSYKSRIYQEYAKSGGST